MPDDYVTNAAWLREVSRPDLIDDVADQFERPVSPGVEAFWTREEGHWPRTPRGWRSYDRWHTRGAERRVG